MDRVGCEGVIAAAATARSGAAARPPKFCTTKEEGKAQTDSKLMRTDSEYGRTDSRQAKREGGCRIRLFLIAVQGDVLLLHLFQRGQLRLFSPCFS
eukprot:CAMPEP_0194330378 /NCGR_PEP_ID=MMETSP0171-20130528/51763_1 /TAXON_ID=218684 /ORGANISM="Corethron pennatum, Strain L29A3" /LENGTH=95 /DNA_ID=CAMNT_0039091453 /DNA_START=95 /DNA_END=382 /DNA_ORIENTATION=+